MHHQAWKLALVQWEVLCVVPAPASALPNLGIQSWGPEPGSLNWKLWKWGPANCLLLNLPGDLNVR